ncbi:hypothetical protein CQW23_14178 [Capsicum baccatum]|uniref:Uncharacterized protein n=1 Tax=Capsicum baccatum TaxID=33114 RepID=A0A2G2WIP7_CAPBA|nr:hypothetical protein CQW23_14178 [Capsicum baccatum]
MITHSKLRSLNWDPTGYLDLVLLNLWCLRSVPESQSVSQINNSIVSVDNKKELEVAEELVQKELEKAMEEDSAKIIDIENLFADRKSIKDALSLEEKNVLVMKNEKEEGLIGKDAIDSELSLSAPTN